MCDRSAASPPTPPTAPPGVAAPDWSTLDVVLHCPRCGYDLRLLPNPRCPECGLPFNWDELIAAARHHLASPLFDYHWRDRPVRSLLLTCWRAMWPWRLWRDLPLAVEPRLGPLVVLLLIALAIQVPVCVSVEYATFDYYTHHQTPGQGITLIAARDWEGHIWAAVGDVTIAALTWLVLHVFRQTIQRYRIRSRQILRLMLLALLGCVLWRAASVLAHEGVGHLQDRFDALPRLPWRPWGRYVWRSVPIVPVVAFFVSLAFGLQVHLRIRRGWAMGLGAAAIVVLLIIAFAASAAGLAEASGTSPYQVVCAWRWVEPLVDWLQGSP